MSIEEQVWNAWNYKLLCKIFFQIYVGEKKKSDQGSFLNFDDSPKILLDVTKKNLWSWKKLF